MKKWIVTGAFLMVIMMLPLWAAANDLSEASEFLCSPSWAISCAANHVCETGLPMEWNIPEFVIADLTKKTLSTPGDSGQNRTTSIETAQSEDGLIIIQGHELGRAFSLVVSESTGSLSGSITSENLTIAVFGACIPLPMEGVGQ